MRIIPALAGNTSTPISPTGSGGNHPRACGEHVAMAFRDGWNAGSSPRLRGTRRPVRRGQRQHGIIPALAGNTFRPCVPVIDSGDHPRACREHEDVAACGGVPVGSSPRLRGTPRCSRPCGMRSGIIPALAGNTPPANHSPCRKGDHPRACGEHTDNTAMTFNSEGSSPRLRGTPEKRVRDRQTHGIIPALAGNTNYPYQMVRRLWDHPRACGEHLARAFGRGRPAGSSPRLRGTLGVIDAHLRFLGIIPALAGNTRLRMSRRTWIRDHPRACGEHSITFDSRQLAPGSSPRLRGTPFTAAAPRPAVGIIPALAGNTAPACTRSLNAWDHPRACGEHEDGLHPIDTELGSSPRLRGTRHGRTPRNDQSGIIPALAGNTHPPRSWVLLSGDHPRACGEHDMYDNVRVHALGSSPRLRGTP